MSSGNAHADADYSQNKKHIKPKMAVEKKELVNHPKHYRPGTYEVIKVIEAWDLNFNIGNAVKYLGRLGKKDKPKQEIQKAIWYLQRELEKL